MVCKVVNVYPGCGKTTVFSNPPSGSTLLSLVNPVTSEEKIVGLRYEDIDYFDMDFNDPSQLLLRLGEKEVVRQLSAALPAWVQGKVIFVTAVLHNADAFVYRRTSDYEQLLKAQRLTSHWIERCWTENEQRKRLHAVMNMWYANAIKHHFNLDVGTHFLGEEWLRFDALCRSVIKGVH